MRTLTLVRHAKSSWKHHELADFDRPLNARGKRDLPLMAGRLAATGEVPDRIVTSPAVRALETARALADVLGIEEASLIAEPRIYAASQGQLLDILQHQPDSAAHVLLVGHAPAIAELSRALCGAPAGKYPTLGAARVHLPVEAWWDVAPGRGELVWFDFPKRQADDGR